MNEEEVILFIAVIAVIVFMVEVFVLILIYYKLSQIKDKL